jgi:DNA helicase HerA-like ATPase
MNLPNKDLAILPSESQYIREISLVFGKTGSGKSNYIKTYLAELSRIIIIDPLNEYPGRPFTDIGEMMDYLEPLAEPKPENKFCVKSCNAEDLEPISEIVNVLDDVTFIIEEAQRCLPASNEKLPDAFNRIIFQGRHFGRSLAIAAQRPSIVNIRARSQWTRVISFNLTEPSDVGWLEHVSGYNLTDSQENDIRKLPVGKYIEITSGDLEVKQAPLYNPPRGKEDDNKSIAAFFESFAFNP